MDRAVFAERLAQAAQRALDFARTMVEETLPEAIRFRVKLNSSYDGNPLHAGERVYPDDHQVHAPEALARMDHDPLVALLWRDGAVPEWINLNVVGEDGDTTIIEAVCCGRFTANDTLLYHQREGWPPFHVLGPWVPPDWTPESRPFSLRWNTTVASAPELHGLGEWAAKVQILTLDGEWCDDDLVASLRGLNQLMTLRLEHTSVDGRGLHHLSGGNALQSLTFAEVGPHALRFDALSRFTGLRSLSADGKPTTVSGLDALAGLPRLNSVRLHLGAVPDAAFAAHLPALESLDLDGSRIESLAPLARAHALQHLSLESTPIGDEQMERLVRLPRLRTLTLNDTAVSDVGVRRVAAIPTLWRLWLVNTAVTDASLAALASNVHLDRLDVRGTRVTLDGVAALARALPRLHIVADGWKKASSPDR
jgi:hypothetical protein